MIGRVLAVRVWRIGNCARRLNVAMPYCSHRHFSVTTCCNLRQTGIFLSDVQPKSASSPDRKPDPGQLQAVYEHLSESLPNFFAYPINYKMYAMNMVFEDNIRNVRTKTLQEYVQAISLLRIYAHLKYAHVRVEVLKMTLHPEDNSVKVRWRIIGVPGLFSRFFWSSWRLRARKPDSKDAETRKDGIWHDGFSIYYINSDGLIHKHLVEPVTPDNNKEPIINKLNKIVNAKLGGIIGIGAMCPPGSTTEQGLSALLDLLSRFM